jgi:hypothetical protein
MVASSASAAPGGGWTLSEFSEPTVLAAGSMQDFLVLEATNTSGRMTDGSPVTISATLPAGLTLDPSGISTRDEVADFSTGSFSCQTAAPECTYAGAVAPGETLTVTIPVDVAANLAQSTVTEGALVTGGGITSAPASEPVSVGGAGATFGFPPGGLQTILSSGQAGAHPDFTTVTTFSSKRNPAPEQGNRSAIIPVGSPKDIDASLPPGLVGNPNAVPQCSPAQLIGPGGLEFGHCPADAQVGLVTLNVGTNVAPLTVPVYNIVPESGEPARLGFYALLAPVYLDAHVRSDGDYGVSASLKNVTQVLPIVSSVLTLWGVPAGPSHDRSRWHAEPPPNGFGTYGLASGIGPAPFMANPTACTAAPLEAGITTDSWQAPGVPVTTNDSLGPFTGCDQLTFDPSIGVQPDTLQAGAPAGYTVELKVPQSNDPAGLATPTLRNASVTLPAGTVLSPSAADGLQGCSDNPGSPAGDQLGLHSLAPATCPQASQIGTLEVHSPLLPNPLEGQVFLGQPNCAPCGANDAQNGNMIRLFLQVQGSGVIVKLRGSGSLNQSTGRITTTFSENPQLPFDDLKLSLKGGPRAPLANPAVCGAAETTADLTPWSSPFTPDATPSSFLEVTGCGAPQFSPSFTAGTINNQAGGFSPLSVTLSRTDQDQSFGQVSVHTPPGLLGMLSKVTLCGEPQAQQGICPAMSQIGHVTVGAGAGSNPLYVPQAGRPPAPVFLTGPYKGAPFGLSIAVPAQAGPFDLGTVLVRAAIYIDPHTAQLTVISDPLPQIVRGIPLNIKTVNVTVDKEGFIFNPTSCEPLSVTGTITSTSGVSANVSSRFQVANCASLPFHPKFTVSTQAHTSKQNGASLDVKVTSGPGQANIGKAMVSLPKQLPSRLTTLQQACPEATFAANPATCPAASNVGTARAVTPVLNEPLSGPAYLVSHGGAAFPDLVVILQGQGVLLDLVGNTNIKKGITISTFNTVPDAPISSFELKLPQGPHSALTTNLPGKAGGSLCGSKLVMPITLTGQNYAVLKQNTKIAVTGCPKAHRARKAKSRRAGKR